MKFSYKAKGIQVIVDRSLPDETWKLVEYGAYQEALRQWIEGHEFAFEEMPSDDPDVIEVRFIAKPKKLSKF